MSEIYTCQECGYQQEISKSTIDDQIGLDYIEHELLSNDDSGILEFDPFEDSRTMPATIEVRVNCVRCRTNMPVRISFRFTPEWDNSRYLKIEEYHDLKIEPFISQDSLDDIIHNVRSLTLAETGEGIDLRILVKTKMNKGFCYLGFDEVTKKIYRPLYRSEEGQCQWDSDIDLQEDCVYSFTTLQFPSDNNAHVTPMPHNNEDLLVTKEVISKTETVNTKELFDNLTIIGQDSVTDIFNNLKEKRYVKEGEESPSVGILKCQGEQIELYNGLRGDIMHILSMDGQKLYDFPYKGIGKVLDIDPHRPAIVLLGLGRPWGGKPDGKYSPRRCYVLALRILQEPQVVQQCVVL